MRKLKKKVRVVEMKRLKQNKSKTTYESRWRRTLKFISETKTISKTFSLIWTTSSKNNRPEKAHIAI